MFKRTHKREKIRLQCRDVCGCGVQGRGDLQLFRNNDFRLVVVEYVCPCTYYANIYYYVYCKYIFIYIQRGPTGFLLPFFGVSGIYARAMRGRFPRVGGRDVRSRWWQVQGWCRWGDDGFAGAEDKVSFSLPPTRTRPCGCVYI